MFTCAKPPPQMAHQRLRKLDQAHGDTTAIHQFPRQHEKRDRHERKTVHPVVKIAIQQGQIPFLTI